MKSCRNKGKYTSYFEHVVSEYGKHAQLLQKPEVALFKVTLIYISIENENLYHHSAFLW